MKRQILGDKIAIGLSILCIFHCLIFPLMFIALPVMASAAVLFDESFHQWLLLAIVPISLPILTLGCMRHKSTKVFLVGVLGIALLLTPWLIGEDRVNEALEVFLTVIGSLALVYSHFKNYSLRQFID
ncbi:MULTISPECIES: MerC domain-containing protein [Pseudoalteromonas]|uniref:MerC domain-containing protein n=1 Tax=Pseudoalteromonas TaxID=53246 RepID=UPI000FFE7D65|nr:MULTISPECIES: MerC domain-containing protein [Pseudoalteromonas]MDW7549754.1 MerC domain-containing protein [Pseudoalteromonas peptidolytica]RXE97848.1 MerC domain-containing protein [Pseudoalteromonas sp. PS5]